MGSELRKKGLLSLIFVAFATLAFAYAQPEEEPVWNWAWREESGELLAYTESGEVNIIGTQEVARTYSVWRLSPQRAIAFMTVNDNTLWYELTSEALYPFNLIFDDEVSLGTYHGYRLDAYHYPYMVVSLTADQSPAVVGPMLLINVETRTIDLLIHATNREAYIDCCRFSDDGQRLWYLVNEGEYPERILVLRERVLSTGTEQLLYRITGDSPNLYPDASGARWLHEDHLDGDGVQVDFYRILYANGDTDLIYAQDFSSRYATYQFLGDDLVSYQPLCSTNCVVHLVTPLGEIYDLPFAASPGGNSISYIDRVNDDELVISLSYQYWLLSTHEEPVSLGYYYRAASHLPPMYSPDRRWLAVTDKSQPPVQQYRVWDLVNQEIVAEFPVYADNPMYMFYDAEGFITLLLDSGGELILYRYEDRSLFHLHNESGRFYIDILPSGNVLYEVYYSNDTALGIYRYDPDEDTSTLLVENVRRIYVNDINYDSYPFE